MSANFKGGGEKSPPFNINTNADTKRAVMEFIEYHYVYYSYEEWGRGYFGSRTCRCLPEEDTKYFGSFKDKTFKPTQKIIHKNDYATREEAYIDEIILQEYYQVIKNPHFANKSKQTSTGFSTYGLIVSDETKKKLSQKRKGKKVGEITKQKISKIHKGRTVSQESRIKMSNSHKGKVLSDEHRQKIKDSCLKNMEKNKKLYCKYIFTFISPSGKIIETYDVINFCKENNLTFSKVYETSTGKQSHHKGWKITRMLNPEYFINRNEN